MSINSGPVSAALSSMSAINGPWAHFRSTGLREITLIAQFVFSQFGTLKSEVAAAKLQVAARSFLLFGTRCSPNDVEDIDMCRVKLYVKLTR